MANKAKKKLRLVTNGNQHQTGVKLQQIDPITKAQAKVFESFYKSHLLLHGIAGTGKTFVSLYLALKEVLEHKAFKRIVIIRSCVPTREIGFMPGTLEEKLSVYEQPYKDIVNSLSQRQDGYDLLKEANIIEFMSTSYIRGLTLDNTIIIVDEMQNMTFGELDSVITRVGDYSKIIFCGDYRQTDLQSTRDKSGIKDFMDILNTVADVDYIEFLVDDIVRSGFVKKYIVAKMELGFG
jgi:phosphate starvation-inducible protein PhoH